jgi:4'-phosphopantetheinyl transferase
MCPGEVHVWSALLEDSKDRLNVYTSHLSKDEIARASRYVFAHHRTNFILARGILRELLARYLSIPEQSIVISSAAQGKPALANAVQGLDLRFNLSHSNGFTVYAFSQGLELGVDVEFIRQDIEAQEIASKYFSKRECEELSGLKGADQVKGFFHCWTRKEAYIKARGEGLKISLDSFSVTLTPGAPARLTSADENRWSVHSIELVPGWASALVVAGNPERIVLRDHAMLFR